MNSRILGILVFAILLIYAFSATVSAEKITLKSTVNAVKDVPSQLSPIKIGRNSNAKLLVENEAVLFSGNIGSTPASGAGTRFMWIPSKAALRAGSVSSVQWNNNYIGSHSTAFGNSPRAEGENSLSAGYSTVATGYSSIALGHLSLATAPYSLAIGNSAISSGSTAVALGHYTTASGHYSTALGAGSSAIGVESTAFGRESIAQGANSVAGGSYLNASGAKSFIFGSGDGSDSYLVNNIPNSFMVGFGSSPTLFVNSNSVGIGTTSPAATLDVNGLARLVPQASAPACTSAIEGAIYYNSVERRHLACDGSSWRALYAGVTGGNSGSSGSVSSGSNGSSSSGNTVGTVTGSNNPINGGSFAEYNITTPAGTPVVVDPARRGWTALSACGNLNVAGARYYLTRNLTNVQGTCFTVTASNIIFDGANYYVDGDDSGSDSGFALTSATTQGFVLKNTNVTDFDIGVNFGSYVVNSTVENSFISSNRIGIMITGNSVGNRVQNNIISRNTEAGVKTFFTTSNNVTSNSFVSNMNYALFMERSSMNQVMNNRINDNAGSGVGLFQTSNFNIVAGNTFARNGDDPIVSDGTGQGNILTPNSY